MPDESSPLFNLTEDEQLALDKLEETIDPEGGPHPGRQPETDNPAFDIQPKC